MTRLDDTRAYFMRGTNALEDLKKLGLGKDFHDDGAIPRQVIFTFEQANELIGYVEALEADRAALLVGFRWFGGMLNPGTGAFPSKEQQDMITRAYEIEKDEDK